MTVTRRRRRRWTKKITRDRIIWTVGILGIIYEVFIDHVEKPTVLIALLAMMGVPPVLRSDEAIQAAKPDDEKPTPVTPEEASST